MLILSSCKYDEASWTTPQRLFFRTKSHVSDFHRCTNINSQSVKSVRNKKNSVRKVHTDVTPQIFRTLIDVWISGISGISVGKIFSVKVRTQTSQI